MLPALFMAAGRKNDLAVSASRPELNGFCLVAHAAPYSGGQGLCCLWRHVYFHGHTVAVGDRGYSPNNLGYRGSKRRSNRYGYYYVCATHNVTKRPTELALLTGPACTTFSSAAVAYYRSVTFSME